MSYDADAPAHWTAYDRITTAVEDARNMLAMVSVQTVLGPVNYERLLSYLACIEVNMAKLRGMAAKADEIVTALQPHTDEADEEV